jgi:glycosyltransferase involved in cell wall biosynthesis
MKTNKIRISLGIPSYNRLDILKRTIKSVLNQSVPPDEFFIIDNCSTDGTEKYLKSLTGITVYRNRKNIGSFENINKVFRIAKYEYVVCLNSDDLILPDYIKVMKGIIAQNNKDVVAFISAGYIIDGEDNIKGIVRPQAKDMLFLPPRGIRNFWYLYGSCMYLSGWTVYKKDIIKKIGYIKTLYNRAAESALTLDIVPYYPVYYSAQPLFALRVHGMQGFEKTLNDTGGENRIFNDITDSYRALLDYEKVPAIKNAFNRKEQKLRIFVRKPIIYTLVMTLFYLGRLKYNNAGKFYKIFNKYYPSPKFSYLTIKLIILWLMFLFKQQIRNILVRCSKRLCL